MIFVGADHRGFALKAILSTWLTGRSFDFADLGAYEFTPQDDYVDYAVAVAQKVVAHPKDARGIIICASGVGADIAANKVKGARCALGFALEQIASARRDDNVNVLALPADFVDGRQAVLFVERFLLTSFTQYDRYLRRIEKIARYEQVT